MKQLFFIIFSFVLCMNLLYSRDTARIKYVLPQIIYKNDTIPGNRLDSLVSSVKPNADNKNETNSQPGDSGTYISEDPPECINYSEIMKKVKYPEEAREDDITGKVFIKVLVGFNGDVIELGEISGSRVFYKEVRRVSMMLKFTIARADGKPVKCWVTVPFNFIITH